MLGSAVSSSRPNDFQPSPHIGSDDRPLTNRYAAPGPAIGCPYAAGGMQSALDSATGLPSSSSSAPRMLAFLTPADVSSNLIATLAARRWFPDLEPGALGIDGPAEAAVLRLLDRVDHLDS